MCCKKLAAGWPYSRIDELLPENWAASQAEKPQEAIVARNGTLGPLPAVPFSVTLQMSAAYS
jgi:hypothetical protein